MNKTLFFLLYFFFHFPCFSSLINHKVVICGVCRDIENELPYSKNIVEHIGSLFSDYRVIMYENNSDDLTGSLLKNWAQENFRVFVKSENLDFLQFKKFVLNVSDQGQFFRPEIIAKARNEVLDIALSSDYDDFSYLIWIDMDFVKHPNYQAFIDIFSSEQEWDAVLANGIAPDGRYWDWYACRFPSFPFGPEMLGMKWYQSEEMRIKELKNALDSSWVSVYSAFGGCGIYKKSSVIGSRYSGLVTESMEKLGKKILEDGIQSRHPQALLYVNECKNLTKWVRIDNKSYLEKIEDDQTGIILFLSSNALIWKMNTFTYHYPSVCEHVPFHASMIEKGHDKLFICPKLIFYY